MSAYRLSTIAGFVRNLSGRRRMHHGLAEHRERLVTAAEITALRVAR